MADEIVQQLGFDASAALDALAKMDSALANFDAQLSRVAESMSVWNEHGRETVQVLKDIASGATAAAAAMSKLQAAFSAQQANGLSPADPRATGPVVPGGAGSRSSGPGAEDHAADRQDAN